MAVGFDSVPFAVYPDGEGFLPGPVAGEGNNPRTYTATVRVAGTDLTTIRGKKSVVSIVPALGFVAGGTLVVEAGVGAKTLVYPRANGDESTVSAILIEIADQAALMTSDEWRATLTFLIVE